MANKLLEGLALAGIDETTRFTLRETWPMIRDSVPFALQAALASMATVSGNGHDDAQSGLLTRPQLDAARERQTKHWENLFAANFDEEYAESVRRTAVIHAQVGLDPRWLVSGYLTTLTELHSLVVMTHANAMMTSNARNKLDRAIRAVDQAVLFDLQLCISAYCEHMAATAREAMTQVMQRLAAPATAAPAAPVAEVPAAPPTPAELRRSASSLFVAAQGRAFGEAQGAGTDAKEVRTANGRVPARSRDETTH
jgi:methyl-accepting chemotaxis protein